MTEQDGIRTRSLGGLPVVSAPDEIDMANADELGEALLSALDGSPAVVADMSQTTFCDSSGLNTLIQASKKAAARGGELRIAACTPPVRRLLAVTGMDQRLHLFASVPDAIAGAPATTTTPSRPA